MERILKIKELTFEAAHYIPSVPKCQVIHGHTYFIRDLQIRCEKFVDVGRIKAVVKDWNHTFIIPSKDRDEWDKLIMRNPMFGVRVRTNFKYVSEPTVENISTQLAEELHAIDGITSVTFELYEGPNQGVEYP